ncbi:MAG: helix-turn-helix transcriptional regulator [Eubacteriales bacterium]|nr:helix-turn-helix transcriptional regulator [Eubacteriales bacterium]
MNKISLETIAKTLGYNKHYICTAFKKDTGITIFDYLNFVRIRHAAEMFSYSDKDLLTICQRVGFTNLSHFNHTFKKLTGLPPGQYKRMFPVDINGNLQGGCFLPNNDIYQIQKISEIFGTFPQKEV